VHLNSVQERGRSRVTGSTGPDRAVWRRPRWQRWPV